MTTDTYIVNSSGKSSIIKDPDATLDYTFDWTAWLAGITDSIVSFQFIIDPGIVLVSSSFLGALVTAIISGGTDGGAYNVTCRITTAAGRIDDRSMTIKIKDR
jgi:hypothetical protein